MIGPKVSITLQVPLYTVDYNPLTSDQCFCIRSNMSSVTSPCTTTSSSPVTDDPHEKCCANILLAFFRSISIARDTKYNIHNTVNPMKIKSKGVSMDTNL